MPRIFFLNSFIARIIRNVLLTLVEDLMGSHCGDISNLLIRVIFRCTYNHLIIVVPPLYKELLVSYLCFYDGSESCCKYYKSLNSSSQIIKKTVASLITHRFCSKSYHSGAYRKQKRYSNKTGNKTSSQKPPWMNLTQAIHFVASSTMVQRRFQTNGLIAGGPLGE